MLRWEMPEIGRNRLELNEIDVPTPGRGEISVRVGAVALNHRDKMVVETGRGLPLHFPFTPGSDLAGTVVATGDGAHRFAVGDRVISTFTPDWVDGPRPGNARTPAYRTLGGFYPGVLAEYVAFPQDWFVSVERGGLRAGQTVLIEGTGGVALFGLQIAKLHGARVVVVAGADKLGRAVALGADDVIDRRGSDWVEELFLITGDRGADHILELVGGAHLGEAVQAVAVGGTISQIGALDGFEISAAAMPLMLKDARIQGVATGHRRALEDLVAAVDRSGLRPVIDTRYPLSELPTALDHLARGPFGKVVIELA